jgi:hypothetical protein
MEVVQEVLRHGSADSVRAVIRANKKSYSLVQLIAASFDVYNILCSKNVRQLLLCSASSFKIAHSVTFIGFRIIVLLASLFLCLDGI